MTDYEEIVKTRMVEIGANNGKPGSTAACLQVESEMVWLAPFIDRLKPKVILEIGIYKAGWPYVLAPFFAEGAHVVGIDSFQRHGWRSDDGRKDLDARIAILRDQGFVVDVIEGRSDDETVLANVSLCLRRTDADVLHIDGAHDYNSVRADWLTYSPFIREGGLVVFHDIGTQTSQMQVKQYWDKQIAPHYTTHAFCEKNGIGIVEI